VSFATVPALADATVTYRSWDFTYPDGAHDAEALLLGPGTQIYVVTKGASPGIYKAPAQPVATKANALTSVVDAPAGDRHRPALRVALRTPPRCSESTNTWETVATSTLPTAERQDAGTDARRPRWVISTPVHRSRCRQRWHATPRPRRRPGHSRPTASR
jgi:hypothetical protein